MRVMTPPRNIMWPVWHAQARRAGVLSARLHSPLPTRRRCLEQATGLALCSLRPEQRATIRTSSACLSTKFAQESSSSTSKRPTYEPPTSGILSIIPKSWVPYMELIRINNPIGVYYLFFPCLFSTFLAAPLATPFATPGSVLSTSLLFLTSSFIMRSASCTINDIWDRNLDPHVARTQFRPVARGAINPLNSIIYAGVQLSVALGILLQFPTPCFYYTVPSIPLVAAYPLGKRVTYYPQFILGLTMSSGAFIGFPALGIDLLSNSAALIAALCLYTSNIAWTVLYDMIYAHMDIKDDNKAGIKSIALKYGANSKKVLTGLAITQITLLAAAGVAAGAGPAFFIGGCGGGLVTVSIMIKRVNLKDAKNCWWWFANGCWIIGGVISFGTGVDYMIRYARNSEDGNGEHGEN